MSVREVTEGDKQTLRLHVMAGRKREFAPSLFIFLRYWCCFHDAWGCDYCRRQEHLDDASYAQDGPFGEA